MKKILLPAILISMILITPIILLFTDTQSSSAQDVLLSDWNHYKEVYIDSDGAVRRRDQGNDVVSEGIAYAMLRAVWLNDQQTFDKVYQWAENNLSRLNNPSLNDNLLAWLYKDNVSDWGAASDADEDYALALAFASKKWGNPTISGLKNYKEKSIAVQNDLLRLETGWIGDKVYLQPGTWNNFKAPIIINPSYLSPAFYKIFNQINPDPRWEKLVQSSYQVLEKSTKNLEANKGVGLPPDWLQVNADGSVSKAPNMGSDYKYDAFRTNFRIALDYIWFGDQRAKNWLSNSGARDFLLKELSTKGLISAEYRYDGQAITTYENAGVYGVNIGWFIPENTETVNLLTAKIEEQFNKNGGKFFSTHNYYMSNWAALGYALGKGNLINIFNTSSITQQNFLSPPVNLLATPTPTSQPVVNTPATNTTPTPQPTTKPSTTDDNQIKIIEPSDNQIIDGKISIKINNSVDGNQGSWWSVDSGSWVSLSKTADSSNLWQGDIDISNWNWNPSKEYILHAWTKDSSNNQYHTQIKFRKP